MKKAIRVFHSRGKTTLNADGWRITGDVLAIWRYDVPDKAEKEVVASFSCGNWYSVTDVSALVDEKDD